MVSEGTSQPMPAATAACRAGICPAPAVSTWPMITYSTADAGTPGLLQRAGDGDRAEIAAREVLQRTHQFADRRAGSSNDHRRRHSYLQRLF